MVRARGVRAAGVLAAVAIMAGSAALPAQGAPPPAPDRQLQFLHVGPVNPTTSLAQVVDESGREVLLRGVNVDGLTDYFRGGALAPGQAIGDKLTPPYSIDPTSYAGNGCVPDVRDVEGVPFCSLDLPQMRPLGYNVIRLAISWSLLEPTKGSISDTYIRRIHQVVNWARAQGIYTIIDMHQDAWSKYLYSTDADQCETKPGFSRIQGYDGAPDWATSRTPFVCALNGIRELDPAVQDNFRTLYDQAAASSGDVYTHFRDLFVRLAQEFGNDRAVAGYEILNEPSPGFLPTAGVFDESELFRMYGKIIDNVVAGVPGFRQLFFIEPNALRNLVDQSGNLLPWSLYSSYPNVVYTPHVYTGVFTLDEEIAHQHLFPSNGGYDSSVMDAQHMGLPLFVSEFGNNPTDDDTFLRNAYNQQDTRGIGGTLWLWKENSNDIFGGNQWGVYRGDFVNTTGTLNPSRLKFTSRAYPLAVAGHLEQLVYNPDTAGFDLHGRVDAAVAPGDRTHAAVLFVPAAATCDVAADNATLDVFDRGGGSREVYAYPGSGAYRVFCGTTTSTTTGAPSPSLLNSLPNTSRW